MLFGADDVGYIFFCRCSAMWLPAVVLIDMYAVSTLLRVLISTLLRVLICDYSGFLPGVAAPVAAMVALTRALLVMMMTRGVQMGLICCIFRLLGVVKCAYVVFCALVGCNICLGSCTSLGIKYPVSPTFFLSLKISSKWVDLWLDEFFVVLALLFGLLLANILSDTNDAAYIFFRCCPATRLLTVVLMNMCVVPALLSVLIGVYGGLLPGVATPVAATSTLTRASLAMMMTRDIHLSHFILQRLDDFYDHFVSVVMDWFGVGH
ncbi:hypothetical protein Hanom_Chr10g00916431 [Helianthus anomalus]